MDRKYYVDASGKWAPDKSSGSDWLVRLQQELNDQFGAGLTLGGIAGRWTLAAGPTVKRGAKGNITKLIQEKIDLAADGIVGKGTWKKLLGL